MSLAQWFYACWVAVVVVFALVGIRSEAVQEKMELRQVLGIDPASGSYAISSAVRSIKSLVELSDVDDAIKALEKLKIRSQEKVG